MENLYEIKDNIAYIWLDTTIYPLITIKKTLFNLMETVYAKIEEDKNERIKISIVEKNIKDDLNKTIGEFYNELLNESLRYDISKETKNIRELILGRALYTTCIENSSEEIKEENTNCVNKYEDFSSDIETDMDEIAVNWFDKYDKKD